MKKILILLPAIAMLAPAPFALAQRAQTGFLLFQDILTPGELAMLSSWSPQYGTARTTAMGGAFTSLGADLSSMHINPAGLGFYQSSEFGFTPMVNISSVKNTDPFYIENYKSRKNRFAPANAGAAINLYQGGGALTSFTMGAAYNRIADFNYTSKMYFGGNDTSLGDAFVQQLNGTPHSKVADRNNGYYSFNRYQWGALMGYETGLIDPLQGTSDQYTLAALSSGAISDQYAYIYNTGSIGEYNLSAGFNFGNKVYFGFSLGIQDIYYKQSVYYEEKFSNNTEPNGAREMYYDIHKKISGSGVNFKAGMIVRPTHSLRIGVAVHTPTYYNVTYDYDADLDVIYADGTGSREFGPADRYEYDFSTPARLMGGISYTFGSMGVLSVDYERTWYNSMRYRRDDADRRDFNIMVKDYFKGTNTVRVGGELRPFDYDFSIRAGFNYTDSMVDLPAGYIYDNPVPKQNIGVSGGIGFRLGRYSTLDLTYAYNQTEYTEYCMYQTDSVDGGYPTQTVNRHTVMASLGFRF